MRQATGQLEIRAPKRGLYEITSEVAEWAGAQGIGEGLLTVFIHHTSASLVIQENVDPDVQRDMEAFFAKLVPEDEALYRHVAEGPDDMPAHIRGALTQTHLVVPVADGRVALGTYQGIFLFEHRLRPRPRRISLHLIGDRGGGA